MREATALFELCRTSDVTPELPFKAMMDGEVLAVFEVEGGYYVTQDHCTHGPGSLSDGYVDGCEVECPFHQGRFNICTGQPTSAPCTEPLRVWKAVVRDGRIYVDRGQPGAVAT